MLATEYGLRSFLSRRFLHIVVVSFPLHVCGLFSRCSVFASDDLFLSSPPVRCAINIDEDSVARRLH
jgi:hypothetical protein